MSSWKLNDTKLHILPQFLRALPQTQQTPSNALPLVPFGMGFAPDPPGLCRWTPLETSILLWVELCQGPKGDRRAWVVQTKTAKIMSLDIISCLRYFCNLLCHYCSYNLSRYMVVNFVCHVCMTDNRWTNTRTKSPTTELRCSLHLVHDSCRWGDLCQSWMWTMARWEDCFVQHVD